MSKHLTAYAVADTRSVEEIRAVLFDVYDARMFDLAGDGNRFAAEAAYFDLGSSSLSYCRHESQAHIEFRDDDYVRVQICTGGNGRTSFNGNGIDVTPDVLVWSPADARMEFGATLEQFALRVDRAALENDLAALLGSRPREPLAFEPGAGSTSPAAQRLRNNVLHAVASIDLADGPLPGPIVADVDRSLRLSMLYALPHNYSALLEAPARHAAPWQVLRIEQWIDANWRQNVTIETLAEVSGVSGRSIFATFKVARGYTPMAYLKKVRLDAARRMLMRAAPGASVTAIGLACQFANLGHFAQDYRHHFGELPSETLSKARCMAA